MQKKPIVSVVIPAYNAALYLSQAIESVLAQTYLAVEVIIVDDGSIDNTCVIIEKYSREMLGVVSGVYQKNKGLSAARNAGIRAARGEYIAFLDADDLFLPPKLERQIAYLEAHPECSLCYCDLWHFYEKEPDRMLKLNYIYYSYDDVFSHLLWKNFINPLSVVLRRSVFDHYGYFNESMRRSEDWDYWISISYAGAQLYFLPEILAKYRMHEGSLTNDWSNKYTEKLLAVDIFRQLKKDMTQEERQRYHINWIIVYHKAKLIYAYCMSLFYPMRIFHVWIQKQRFK